MAKKKQNDEPQSQSIPGPTADNPNEDGQQSTIQPGCPHCDAVCLCVCHRWAIPVRDEPVEDA
jgi:hypothetical protein